MEKIYNYFYTDITVTTFKLLAIDTENKEYSITTVNDESKLPADADIISDEVFDLLLSGMSQASYKEIK